MARFDDGPEAEDFGVEDFGVDDSGVDELLRREFAQAFSSGESAAPTLVTMEPAIRRAHRVHRIRQAAVGTAAVVALVGGLAMVARSTILDEVQITVAGENEKQSGDGDSPDDATLVVTGSTVTSVEPEPEDADSGDESPNPTISDATSITMTDTTPTTVDPQSSTTTPTSSSEYTSTSVAADGSVEIYSACGSIVVAQTGDELELRAVNPASGLSDEVKSSGPDVVEVSIEGDGGHCEFKIHVERGELDIDVDDESRDQDES